MTGTAPAHEAHSLAGPAGCRRCDLMRSEAHWAEPMVAEAHASDPGLPRLPADWYRQPYWVCPACPVCGEQPRLVNGTGVMRHRGGCTAAQTAAQEEEIAAEVAGMISDRIGGALMGGDSEWTPAAVNCRSDGARAVIDLADGRQVVAVVTVENPVGH